VKLFRFDATTGRPITHFNSVNLAISPIQRFDGHAQLGCMHLGPGGVVGYHQATSPQLFLVVQGAGWVRGEDPVRHPIMAGHAAFWQTGEWHESGTDGGMMVMVCEADSLDPAQYLVED
jgi:quercetin dioxygenase-like cupin family protein